jgi:HPt (histidine-containing phosphotransfer) domain-containing protein
VSDDLQEILASLRAVYAADLPALVASLAASLDRARRDPSAELVRAARGEAHRIHGTAGSYGFKAAGEEAGRIEASLDDLAARRGTAEDAWRAIDRALAALRAEAVAVP